MRQFAKFTVLFALMTGWLVAAGSPIAVFPINEESIAQMSKQHPLASAEVDDPVYKRKQRYQGIGLRDLLVGLERRGHGESDLYVRFRCKDGYLPTMPLSRATAGEGFIAIRDANAPKGQDWELLPDSKTPSTPAPSYLVWLTPRADPEEYPWPYKMVAVELVSSSDVLSQFSGQSAQPGQELFVRHCLKCHAINSVGGTLGPELNSPCSVTEYWNPVFLARFIARASSIRAGTKMPNFDSLPESDVQALIRYLQSMAGQKLPGAVCPGSPMSGRP